MSDRVHVEETIEEDWSHIMKSSLTGTHFSNHSLCKISLSPSVAMEIACVEHLTPLDMISLSYGTSDPTGNRIWMGALAFIELFVRPIKSSDHKEVQPKWFDRAQQLKKLRKELFHDATILELGAGTGTSGISLAIAHKCDIDESLWYRPKQLTFTDNDSNVLNLCKRNCDLNLSKDGFDTLPYEVMYLEWGMQMSGKDLFNVVIATDVIYNLSSLEPIFQTSHDLLKPGGYFVLSHVPRASIVSDEEPRVALENQILATARNNQFELFLLEKMDNYDQITLMDHNYALRPEMFEQLLCNKSENSMDNKFKQMESVGVAVFIFIKLPK